MNTQFSDYEYIRYSYSANLLRTNIFDNRIQTCCKQLIYLIFVFSQFSKNEYIRYSYSVLLQTMNIFDIRVRSAVRIWIYSIFIFGKIFHKYVLIYRQTAEIIGYLHKYAPKLIQNLLYGGGGSSKVYILYKYSIFIFSQVSNNEYIWYSYSVMYLRTNIFDNHIRSGCQTQIYLMFVFG